MPDVTLKEKLHTVASSVLEEAAFIFTESVEEAPEWPGPLLEAKLTFSAQKSGVLSMISTQQFCVEIAANLLGIDPSDPTALSRGSNAICEMLNIICGSFVVEVFGNQVVTHIGIPEARPLVPSEDIVDPGSMRITLLDDEERRIDFSLVMND